MAEITFGGLATGLPTDDIVTKLMALERRPLDRLDKQKTYESNRLKAYGQLKTRLDDLRSAVGDLNITSEVRTSKIELSSSAPFSAVSAGAGSGSYDIAVAQLAQGQKNVSDGLASQTDALLGTGSLTLGGKVITIDSSNNSLLGLQGAINAVSESTGVSASIINDGSASAPYRLILTGKDASTTFTPTFDLVDSNSAPLVFNTTQTRTAQQAVAYVDGIKVVSGSNVLTGVLSGVTLNLNEASATTYAGTAEDGVAPPDWADPPVYATTSMTVAPDTAALKEKLTAFVDGYNGVMDWISSGYAEFGASAPSEQDIKDGAEESFADLLRGDSAVNGVKRQLQSILSTAVDSSGSLQSLSQLGISTQRDGSLSMNTSTLDKALTNSFDDVAKLLAGDDVADGIMKKFNSALLDLTSSSSGMYANKKTRYDAAVQRIDSDLLRMEPLLAKKEQTLRSQFNAMEQIISGMNSQSNFLTQQMDILNNMMTGGK